MVYPKKREGLAATEHLNARVTPGERAALDALIQRRAAEMEAQSIPGDSSFAGWLRWIIRREAKAAGITIEGVVGAEVPRPSTAKPRTPAKRAKRGVT